MICDGKIPKWSDIDHVEAGLHPPNEAFLQVMTTCIQEKQNHSQSRITVKVSRGTQKGEILFAKENFGLAFFSVQKVRTKI